MNRTKSTRRLRTSKFVSTFTLLISLCALLLPGCQAKSEKNELFEMENAIIALLRDAESSVVVVEAYLPHNAGAAEAETAAVKRIGSGFVYRRDGYIVCTESLLEDSDSLTVINQDGERFPVQVVGRDFETNLAVLKAADGTWQPLELDPRAPETGYLGIALGNTFYSQGIAVGWGLINHTRISGDEMFERNLLSVRINWTEVHSGTPVIGSEGRLIGITEGKLAGGNSIWTVIPAGIIEPVARRLIMEGKIERGWAGIISDAECEDAALREFKTKNKGKGAVVTSVVAGGPAEKAGVRAGDIILSVNGEAVTGVCDFRKTVTRLAPGSQIALSVLRGGETVHIDIMLASIPADPGRLRRAASRSA
jgi:S1-C subfamily serine protease